MRSSVFCLSLILGAAVIAGSAHATEVNYTGTQYQMNTVLLGQEGTITTDELYDANAGSYYVGATGAINPGTKITFSYTLTGGTTFSSLSEDAKKVLSSGYYAYFGTDGFYAGSSSAEASGGSSDSSGSVLNGGGSSSSTPLVLATANIIDDTHGETVIENLSGALVTFYSSLINLLKGEGVIVTYKVTALPLPAAFPLFGAGLVGLAALGRRRKKAARAA